MNRPQPTAGEIRRLVLLWLTPLESKTNLFKIPGVTGKSYQANAIVLAIATLLLVL